MSITTPERPRTAPKSPRAPDAQPWTGQPVLRKEDERFVQGQGEYVDDRNIPDALYMVPVRSTFAHARINSIDIAAALEVPGVLAVITGKDLEGQVHPADTSLPPPFNVLGVFPLARDKVRYIGEPVAAVIATSPYEAEDGAAVVEIDYEPLDPVPDPFFAMTPEAPIVHESTGSNVAWQRHLEFGDVDAAFARAYKVVRRNLHFHRFSSTPLEPAAAVVSYNPRTDVYDILCNIQSPERYRAKMARALGVRRESLHIQCPDIGGGFGIKTHYEWVILLCWLSRRLGKPVKFIEDRTGHILASHHCNEIWYDAELAVDAEGHIEGLRATLIHDAGAYAEREPKGAVNQLRHIAGMYTFRNIELNFQFVVTTRCPTGPNRAYGKVQSVFLTERLIDEAARELGIDPVEMRIRNLIQPEQMPYETPVGSVYDGGDYPELMRRAIEQFDYPAFRAEQARARAEGRYLGCGIALGIEASPSDASIQKVITPDHTGSGDSESARIRVGDDGVIWAALGTVPQGHGHETVVAQIIADELGVTPDEVTVTVGFDSWRDPSTAYSGTHASRFASMGVGAVVGAARALKEKMLRIAAHVLHADASDLILAGGVIRDRRSDAAISLRQLARVTVAELAQLPEGEQPALDVTYVYRAPFGPPREDGGGNYSLTYAYGITFVSVEIDPETGQITPKRIVCVDDCGKRLNPMIVEGQIHGAIAHQVGAALLEAVKYDEYAQPLTSTFKDYLTATAADLPSFETGHLETPSLVSVLGARGGGEGSGTPLVAAIAAVEDALRPWNVFLSESHVTPCDVRTAIREASATAP